MAGMAKLQRLDGWISALTKLGTAFDKLQSYQFRSDRVLNTKELSDLYYFNGLAGVICNIYPEDAMREGVLVKDKDGQPLDDVQARLQELDAVKLVTDAACWGRAFGAAGVYLGVEDGQLQDQPLDPTRVTAVKFLRAVDRRDLVVTTWYGNPLSTKFNQPELFTFAQPSNGATTAAPPIATVRVHETRFLWFYGDRTGQREARELNNGFPLSVLQKVNQQLLRVGTSWDMAAQLIATVAQVVMKIDGFRDAITSEGGLKALEARAQMVDAARGITRSLWVDLNEEVEVLSTPVTGIAEILDGLGAMLAACTGIPVTKLFGTQPTGLGATGAADERTWNNRVESYRKQQLQPMFDVLASCLAAELKLGDVVISFASLDRPTMAETAAIRFQVAQADALYVTNQIVLPEEIAESRFGGPEYSIDTQLQPGPRENLFPEPEPPVVPGAKPGAKPAKKPV